METESLRILKFSVSDVLSLVASSAPYHIMEGNTFIFLVAGPFSHFLKFSLVDPICVYF